MPMSPLPHQTTLLRRYGVRTRLARLARSICPAFIFLRCPVRASGFWWERPYAHFHLSDIFLLIFWTSLLLVLRQVYFSIEE